MPEKKLFLEIFSGPAHLIWVVAQHGVPILAPIELKSFPRLVHGTNVFDIEPQIREWLQSGWIGWLHLATECKTYSAGRNGSDGGPRSLRDDLGNMLPDLSLSEQELAENGEQLLVTSMNYMKLGDQHGAVVTLENPFRFKI